MPTVLPLGKTPRALTMVPAHDGWMHLLWLDESLPGAVRVWTTVVSADGHVDHAPIAVNNKVTSTYSVLALANGSALTLWTDASRRSSLYAQVLDDVGRPFGAVYLSDNVNFPSAALDLSGRLHLAWLEAQSPTLWVIHYLLLSDPRSLDFQASLEPPQNSPIGLIHLTAGQTIGSFAIAADASRVYMLWTALDASTAASSAGVIGSAHGLSFPLGDDSALGTLSFAASGLDSPGSAARSNVRSLYIQKVAEKTLAVGALVGNWDENTHTWQDTPAALPITPSGVGALQPVFAGTADETLGDVALASDPGGGLVVAWSTLHANGKSTITLASTR